MTSPQSVPCLAATGREIQLVRFAGRQSSQACSVALSDPRGDTSPWFHPAWTLGRVRVQFRCKVRGGRAAVASRSSVHPMLSGWAGVSFPKARRPPPGAWRWRVAREKMSVPPSPGRKPPGPARAGHRELWGSSLVPLCGRGRRARHSQHLIGCQRFLAWCDGWEGGCHRNIESCIHASRGFIGTLCGGEMVVNTSLGFIHTSDVIIVSPVIGPVVAFV